MRRSRFIHHLARIGVPLALIVTASAPAYGADRRASDGNGGGDLALVALLAPRDGAVLNAESLRVQVLVASLKPDPQESVVFNGQRLAGKIGKPPFIDIAVDGNLVDSISAGGCGGQALLEARLDLTGLASGLHTLTVTAYAGGERHAGQSATATFTLDPTAPVAETNRIETAATPLPFSCLDLEWKRRMRRWNLEGRLVLNAQSDGVDPAGERLVIVLGDHVTVLEPGTLRCRQGTCRFTDRGHPLMDRFVLKRRARGGVWELSIRGGPAAEEASTVRVRIGNDWGGLDLATKELLIALRPTLDATRRAEATIGPAGGTIQATDAAGLGIRLDVPAGILPRDTSIAITPLLSSSLAGASGALRPGVRLEPEGLAFAAPVTLTVDFTATGAPVPPQADIFLVTSPLTMLPLLADVDPVRKTLSVQLEHFSELVPADALSSNAFTDLQVWADPKLVQAGLQTLSELRYLGKLIALCRETPTHPLCEGVNPDALQQELTSHAPAVIAHLFPLACSEGRSSPSKTALNRLALILRLVQDFEVALDHAAFTDCARDILRPLIEQAGAAARGDPLNLDDANDPALKELLPSPSEPGDAPSSATLGDYATKLDVPDMFTLAIRKLLEALEARSLSASGQAAFQPANQLLTDRLVRLALLIQGFSGLSDPVQGLDFAAAERRTWISVAFVARQLFDIARNLCESDRVQATSLLVRAGGYAGLAATFAPDHDPSLRTQIAQAIENCGTPQEIPNGLYRGRFVGENHLVVGVFVQDLELTVCLFSPSTVCPFIEFRFPEEGGPGVEINGGRTISASVDSSGTILTATITRPDGARLQFSGIRDQ